MRDASGLVLCIAAVGSRFFSRVAARLAPAHRASCLRSMGTSRDGECALAQHGQPSQGDADPTVPGAAPAHGAIDGKTREDTEIGRLTVIVPMRKLSSSDGSSCVALATAPC